MHSTRAAQKRCNYLPELVNHPFFYESVFGVSDQVSVRVVAPEVGPWQVTVTVKEIITGKPVEGATVQIDGVVGTTGTDGSVTLTVEGGKRIIIVSKSGYWTKIGDRLITQDTTIDVNLVPIWMLIAGGVGGVGIAGLIVWLWRKM